VTVTPKPAAVAAALALAAVLVGAVTAMAARHDVHPTGRPAALTPAPTTTPVAPTAPTAPTASAGTPAGTEGGGGHGWPAYASGVAPVSAARLGASWHPGCPVGPARLRLVTVRYAGFDGAAHDGQLVVAAAVTDQVRAIFAELYRLRYPIRGLRTVDAYGASDDASMAADNSSAFNCRPITGGTGWSRHAYGRAVDLNPRENPYIKGSVFLPPDATTDRHTRGAVTPAVVAAFARYGWMWGGTWTDPTDYQHFERT
jgi:hypothetical protein